MRNSFASIAVLAALTMLTGCGGGGDGGSSGPVAVAPAISTQPANSTVTDGQPASFSVTANGTAPLSYQWKRNGVNISGATAASYNISAVTFNDSGTTFGVIVTNSAGSATSASATLTVSAIAPAITSQPASQAVTVNDGSASSFSVVASGSAVLLYQWQRKPAGAGGSFADVNGATSATYTFVTALTNEGDQYQVIVSNSAGTVTSNPFILHVTPTTVLITTQPVSQHVSQGKPVTFTVVASGSGVLTYQWQRKPAAGSSFADIPGATSSTYSLTTLITNDGDQYQVAVNNGAMQPSLSLAATLTVSASVVAPSMVTISPAPAGGNYAEGITLTLNAVVDSGATTPLSYQWQRNGVNIPGEVGDHLTIGQLTAPMEGSTYSVTARNSAPGSATSATFTVHVTAGQLTVLAGTVGGVGSRDGTGSAALFNLPYGAAIDASGNTFVTDKNNHTVRKITPDGVVTTIAGQAGRQGLVDGAGTSAALFNNPRGLTIDGAGNIYVADEANNAIRKISADGSVTTLGSGSAFSHPSGVALIGTDLYVADAFNNRICKVDLAASNTVTTVSGGAAGYLDSTVLLSTYNQPFGISADATNHVLYVADNTNNVVRKIDLINDTVTTVAGKAGPAFFGFVDGSLAVARLKSVYGVAYVNNTLYLADHDNHAIRKVDLSLLNTDANYITTFAGSLMGIPGAVGGVGTAARFNLPSMVAVNQSGDRLVVVNFGSNTINDIDVATRQVEGLVGSSAARGWHDGAADGSLFNSPQGLAMDSRQRIYVADNSNDVIRMVDLGKARTDSAYVTTLAGTPGVAGTTNGAATTAQFNQPDGVAVDAVSGAVYVADSANNVVRKISGGQVTTIADAGAVLNKPRGVVVDASGNVYAASSGNHRIYMITASTLNTSSPTYTLVAGTGVAGFAEGPGGTGSAAKFSTPVGLSLDAVNNMLYVADRDNNAIRKIDVTNPAAATVSTLAGGGAPGSLDGNGNAARFSGPLHVAVDGSAALGQPGSVYVSDFGNHAIRKVSASGQVTTVVGVANQLGVKLGALPGGLNGPWGVAVDTSSSNNGLFIADDVEQAILNVKPAP